MGICTRHRPTRIALAVAEVLRAASICAPIALLEVHAVMAQPVASAPLAAAIPAQPLTQALAAFANQTGLQLVYVSGVMNGQKSHAAAAGLSATEALTRMLKGTGLKFEYLTPHSIRILDATRAGTATGSADETMNEIIVTANRRSEALQNVPITIQVLTNATLAKLNATTFEDFLSYLPAVTAHGVGPAQNSIFIRGLGTNDFPNQGSGFGGAFPNVAIYLDEQSAQLPGRNLDVYAADLERIEVLEGPQGTLFGAGAEAGVLRYITNKPQLDVTEASVNAGYAVTAHGDPSSALDAVINLPLIPDTLAVRGVIYSERRGGYIDNTLATFARAATDVSIGLAGANGAVPANSVVISNASLVADNINPVTYQGLRIEALYKMNDDWSVLLAQSYQSMEADGVFAVEAVNAQGQPQPDLTVQQFNPSYNKDRFENTALTIDGRIGALRLLYAGSYLVRNVDQQQDYTNYARTGLYVDYYQCANPGPTPATAQCFTPSSFWRAIERNTHLSQELRLSTPDDTRIRAVGGLFYEDYKIYDQSDWYYLTALPYFNPVAPPTGYWTLNGKILCGCPLPGSVFVPLPTTSINPNPRPLGDGFFNDITRGYDQKAAYASVDFDLIPQSLTLTAGTRYFSTNTWEVGSLAGSYGCQLLYDAPVPNPCINRDAANLNALGLDRTYSGFRSRANLSWKVRENALLYYTWSQGFRSGSFNRNFFTPTGNSPLAPGPEPWQAQASLHGGWTGPLTAAPDNLINNELGWKTSWLDQRLQWNGSIYQENWDHAQLNASDPDFFGGGGETINGGDYRVRGLEISGNVRLIGGLSIDLGAAWNRSALIKQETFYWADGTPIDFNTLLTSSGTKLPNPSGPLGIPLAGAPPFQGNLRARYETDYGGYHTFAQVGAVHQSHSFAGTYLAEPTIQGQTATYDLPGFTTYDAALGSGKDGWIVQIYADNLTDTRAQLYANDNLSYKAVTVNRPRTIGMRMSYKFRGS
jgi:outer membrane receptor protein involved in Fe transport